MAILRDTRYPGRWSTRTNLRPQGGFKNKSSPTSLDGSYAEEDWLNDWDGFFGRLLTVAGIQPNGTVDDATSSQYYDALLSLLNSRCPTGSLVQSFGLLNDPSLLLCDGSAKSRSEFANLFSVIGTTYGSGDGSTTFNIPEARGEFLRCADMSRGIDLNRVLGSSQLDQIASHDHGYLIASSPDSAGSYVYGRGGGISGTGYVQKNGGTETRPRNISVVTYIRI